jgi:Type II secretion system (T2SS), protein M subtype b
MRQQLLHLRYQLGALGFASLLLLAAAATVHFIVLKPLEGRNDMLKDRVARQAPRADPGQPASTADKVSAVYDFLRTEEQTTDWLAKLHGIGTATGVQFKTATYRTQQTEGRIVRYEIVLPVAGSYPQIREFLRRSLAEIPVMSIDQLALKRESRKDGALQAELRMTLHMVKS